MHHAWLELRKLPLRGSRDLKPVLNCTLASIACGEWEIRVKRGTGEKAKATRRES